MIVLEWINKNAALSIYGDGPVFMIELWLEWNLFRVSHEDFRAAVCLAALEYIKNKNQ